MFFVTDAKTFSVFGLQNKKNLDKYVVALHYLEVIWILEGPFQNWSKSSLKCDNYSLKIRISPSKLLNLTYLKFISGFVFVAPETK